MTQYGMPTLTTSAKSTQWKSSHTGKGQSLIKLTEMWRAGHNTRNISNWAPPLVPYEEGATRVGFTCKGARNYYVKGDFQGQLK